MLDFAVALQLLLRVADKVADAVGGLVQALDPFALVHDESVALQGLGAEPSLAALVANQVLGRVRSALLGPSHPFGQPVDQLLIGSHRLVFANFIVGHI